MFGRCWEEKAERLFLRVASPQSALAERQVGVLVVDILSDGQSLAELLYLRTTNLKNPCGQLTEAELFYGIFQGCNLRP